MQHGERSTYRKGCRCDECKAANAAYQRRWYAENLDKARELNRERNQRWYAENLDKARELSRGKNQRWRKANPDYFSELRGERRAQAIDMLGGVCVKCGTTEGLEFDHVDPSTKEFVISTYLLCSWDVILPELRKCQLLCNACHKAKTAEDRKAKVPA